MANRPAIGWTSKLKFHNSFFVGENLFAGRIRIVTSAMTLVCFEIQHVVLCSLKKLCIIYLRALALAERVKRFRGKMYSL